MTDLRVSVGIPVVEIDAATAQTTISACLNLVETASPGGSARGRTANWQRVAGAAVVSAMVAGFVFRPGTTSIVLAWIATLVYLTTIAHRVMVFRSSIDADVAVSIEDDDARAYPDELLPTYTVLVPAFGEPEVIPGLIASLGRLEYPHDKLEIMLLLETGDDATLTAAQRVVTTLPISVLIVPAGAPQTKPRALDYGFLLSSGELVTVYDAEDQPDPLQLRKAAMALARLGDEFVCVQARLEFYDHDHNRLSKLFATEYLTWFNCFLPGLMVHGAPIPLGGTSNHFRREALERVGAWDPYNVTEDADLGLRLQRFGYRVGMLDSVTYEESNSDLVNWVKQRSRWQKGYLQTALVHLRRPRQLANELGWRGVAHLLIFVGGTPVLAATNLVFWSLTLIWFVTKTNLVEAMFPGTVFYLATGCWLIGNATILYLGIVTLLVTRRAELLASALLMPFYWILMSVAALRAMIQLVTNPFHWEKTQHGLRHDETTEIDLREL